MRSAVYGPMPEDDDAIGKPCLRCRTPFAAGDRTTLLSVRPGRVDSRRRPVGFIHPSVAVQVHAGCQPVRTAA